MPLTKWQCAHQAAVRLAGLVAYVCGDSDDGAAARAAELVRRTARVARVVWVGGVDEQRACVRMMCVAHVLRVRPRNPAHQAG